MIPYIRNVSSLSFDTDRCTGCGRCVEVCPRGVFVIKNNRATIIDKDFCMECGACMSNCSFEALHVKKGVGCAYAVIYSRLKGLEEVTCGCGDDSSASCCGSEQSSKTGKSGGSCCC